VENRSPSCSRVNLAPRQFVANNVQLERMPAASRRRVRRAALIQRLHVLEQGFVDQRGVAVAVAALGGKLLEMLHDLVVELHRDAPQAARRGTARADWSVSLVCSRPALPRFTMARRRRAATVTRWRHGDAGDAGA
jgi:hypothetical protein